MKTNLITRTATLTLLAIGGSVAFGFPIADDSFENLPLDGYANVLDNWIQGTWGSEYSSITGSTSNVLTAHGSKMLSANAGGDVWTQTVQLLDVSALAGLIDSGGAVANFRALYNYDGPAGAQSLAGLWSFGQSDRWGSHTNVLFNTAALDGVANTWEHNVVSMTLPVGTRWLITEVGFVNASLGGQPGYVDAGNLEIVPEPSILVAAGVGLAALLRRRTTARK